MGDSGGPDGLLVVDKPSGMTSHDVVDRIRKVLHTRKVGHAGTLDPDATGVLVVGVGKATRLLALAQGAPKRYVAEAKFGITTTTQDASGDIVGISDVAVTEESVRGVLARFRGPIEQVPPMVSAVKVGGERLYRKARRGEEVERAARPVHVYELELVGWDPGAHPIARFEISCSAGTYVRTLIADVGDRVGAGAHMTSLRRIASGRFTIDDAIALDDVTIDALRPLKELVADLNSIDVDDTDADAVTHGRKIDARPGGEDGEVVAVTHNASLIALCRRRGDVFVPEKVLAS